jgi:hypothetical protein
MCTRHAQAYCYMSVLMLLLYMCPHAAIYVSVICASYTFFFFVGPARRHVEAPCAGILLCVSSNCYICVSSYYYVSSCFFFWSQELRVTKQLRVCGSALDDAARECEELATAVAARCDARMLTYAHVCSRMLTYAHVCARGAAVAARCDARMLTYADICSRRGKALNLLALLVQKYQY